jgi:DNA-binding response OmpR family regulator
MVVPIPVHLSKRIRVLLVEDNDLVAEGLRFALTERGFEVEIIRDGWAAIGWMTTEVPEVIVVDLTLPDLDGLVVAEMARRDWPEMPVIIMSGLEEPISVTALLQNRQTAFLQKPFEVDSLVAAIEHRMPHG